LQVEIIELKSGKLAASVPVVLRGMNCIPSDQECFEQAWKAAVDDGNVDPVRPHEYQFR